MYFVSSILERIDANAFSRKKKEAPPAVSDELVRREIGGRTWFHCLGEDCDLHRNALVTRVA